MYPVRVAEQLPVPVPVPVLCAVGGCDDVIVRTYCVYECTVRVHEYTYTVYGVKIII